MTKQLRLGGFFSVPGNHLAGWRHPDAVPTYDMDFQGYAHITQVAEAAKFDTIFFQDTVGVAGSRALARGERTRAKLSRTVKLEPTATLAALAMVTERIGLVATATLKQQSCDNCRLENDDSRRGRNKQAILLPKARLVEQDRAAGRKIAMLEAPMFHGLRVDMKTGP